MIKSSYEEVLENISFRLKKAPQRSVWVYVNER